VTICIAAIGENKDILAIADKKLTAYLGVTSGYEINENKKIIKVTPNCLTLFAGNVLAANDILARAKQSINDTDTVVEVANKISAAYAEEFKSAINTQVLQKHGLDIASFNAQQRSLDQTFVNSVIETINNNTLGVEILIVGKDGDTPYILKMLQNGALENHTPLGYACVGSGSSHANLSLIESETHAGMDEAVLVYAILKAKRKAEYDPGVGAMSSIAIINNGIEFLIDEKIKKLWNEYEGSVKRISKIADKSSIIMKGIVYGTTTR
jgi:20S proteasome alpha/beta subunit